MTEGERKGPLGQSRGGIRPLVGAGLVLVALAAAQEVARRAVDPLPGAVWIGLASAAREGQPAEVAFVKGFELASPARRLEVEIESDRSFELAVDGRILARGASRSIESRSLAGPFAAGSHQLTVFVRHPEGVASIRLRLRGEGERKKGVVTDPTWRADDARRIRDRGPLEARYPVAVWGMPPLSSWGVSSVSRS